MAKKDVQLVVRAKNEASSALNSVAQSLSKVNKELLEGAKSSQSASSGMSELGEDVSQLSKRLEGLRGIGQAAQSLDRVKNSIGNMRDVLARTSGEFVNFSRQARTLQSSLAAQRDEAARLTQTLNAQQAATKEAYQNTLKRSEATRALTAAENALKAAQNKKTQDAAAIAQAAQAYEAAKARVEAYAAAHARLKAEQADTANALRNMNAAIREQERDLAKVENLRDNAIRDARTQKTAIDETAQSYDKLSAEISETSQKLGALSTDQKELAAATKQAEDALDRQAQAMAALKRYSTGTEGGFADPKTAAILRDQRNELELAQAAWKALEADIRSQAEAMRAAGVPADQIARSLQNTITAARQAKTEFNNLQSTLKATESTMLRATNMFEQADDHVRRFAEEMRRIPKAPPTSPWQSFFRSIYGESRQAMSWLQRLRGEVIALGTAYVGLYGTINQVGGVISAYQSLEAAQNRLGVVFKQNGAQVRTELLWLERQANRLGIEFGTLSDQYGKFAIAAQTANFSSEGTREVFMAVAEAGRVAKLSNDQLKGTFLALEQMISKGRIQSEELRQQLGERLPGAVSILAKSLGVTTAELAKMMEQGQVIADESTMLKFAQELNRQFGPQLAQSLQSSSANIGRFFNNIYQAQLRVAKGGLMDGLNKALAALDEWFQSREGRDFFLSLGAAAGRLLEVLAQIPQYFDLIIRAVQTIVALKLGAWFAGIVKSLADMKTTVQITTVQMDAFSAKVKASVAALTSLRAADIVSYFTSMKNSVRESANGFTLATAKAAAYRGSLAALSATMTAAARIGQTLFAAIGGWVGIAATAVSFLVTDLIGRWVGGVDDATAAMDEHDRILQATLTAYDELAGKTKDWADNIKDVTLAQSEANFLKQAELYNKALDDLKNKLNEITLGNPISRAIGDAFSGEQLRKVREFVDTFDPRNFDAAKLQEFTDQIVALNSEISDPAAKKFALELINVAEAALRAEGNMEAAASIAKLKGSILDGVAEAAGNAEENIGELAEAAEDSADGLDEGKTSADNYRTALEELRGMIPSVAAEMKKLQDASKLDNASLDAARAALAAGQGLGDTMNAYGRAAAEQRLIDIDTTPLISSLDLNSATLDKFYNEIKGQANNGARRFQGITLDTLKSAEWQNANLATITTSSGFKQQVHREAAAALQGFINELEGTGYKINQFGGFNPRPKKDTRGNFVPGTISEHSYGYAIDINWDKNPYLKQLVTDFPDQIGRMAAKYGLSWGGDWRGNKDAMHFEYTGRQAPGTRAGTEFELESQQKITAEVIKQNDVRNEMLTGMQQAQALDRIKATGDERALAQRIALNAAQEKGITDAATLHKVAAEAGRIYDAEQAARVAAQQAATDQELLDLQSKIDYQTLVNEGKEREAVIEQGIREAIANDPSLANDEVKLAKLRELIGLNYDLANAENSRQTATEAAEQRINELMEYRSTLMENLRMQMEMGDTAGAQQTQQALNGVNQELQAAIQNAIQMWQAIGGPQADMAIAKLRNVQMQIQGTRQQMGAFGLSMQQWQGLAQNFAQGMMGLFQRFAQAIGQGEDAMEDLGRAFLEFAANFLIQIGQMIIQAALFGNTMQGAGGGMGGGGGIFGSLFGGLFGFGHTGGLVGSVAIGSGNPMRSLSLPYYHNGGVVGLQPDETLAVLRQGEEVLTENDPRHIFNGGGSSRAAAPAPNNIKIVNSFDSGEVVSEGLNTAVGEEAIINVVRRNSSTFKEIVNT